MLGRLRDRTAARGIAAALVLLALAVALLFPPGFMPGDLARPMVLCEGLPGAAEPMVAMDHGATHAPADAPADDEHRCPFAAGAASPLVPAPIAPETVRLAIRTPAAAQRPAVAIGHGLAAPPPPSRAPPTIL